MKLNKQPTLKTGTGSKGNGTGTSETFTVTFAPAPMVKPATFQHTEPPKPITRTVPKPMFRKQPRNLVTKVSWDRMGRLLHVTGPSELLTSLPFVYIDPFNKKQTDDKGVIPLTLLALDKLMEADPKTVIADDVWGWYGAEQGYRERLAFLFENGDPAFEARVPEFEALYSYQRRDVAFALESFRHLGQPPRLLNALDPRLGKTMETLSVLSVYSQMAERSPFPMMFCVLKPTIQYWVDSLYEGWFAGVATSEINVINLDGVPLPERLKMIANSNPAYPEIFVGSWATLRKIQDLKNSYTVRTFVGDEAAITRNRKAQVTEGLHWMRPEALLLLTATPVERGPQDYFALLKALRPREINSYWRWVGWYCKTRFNGFGQDIIGPMNVDIMKDHMFPFTLRRRAADTVDIPEKVYETLRVPTTEEFDNVYKKFATEVLIAVEGAVTADSQTEVPTEFIVGDVDDYGVDYDDDIEITNELTRLTRLRQLTVAPRLVGFPSIASPKAGTVSALCEKYGDMQIVVFCSFRGPLNDLQTELWDAGHTSIVFTGDPDELARYNRGEAQVLLTTPYMGGVGLDLSVADVIIYYDLPLSATVVRQSVERTTKVGLKKPRLIVSIEATHIDRIIFDLVQNKLETIDEVDIVTEALVALQSGGV